jgi:hypothetical protein
MWNLRNQEQKQRFSICLVFMPLWRKNGCKGRHIFSTIKNLTAKLQGQRIKIFFKQTVINNLDV